MLRLGDDDERPIWSMNRRDDVLVVGDSPGVYIHLTFIAHNICLSNINIFCSVGDSTE